LATGGNGLANNAIFYEIIGGQFSWGNGEVDRIVGIVPMIIHFKYNTIGTVEKSDGFFQSRL